MRIQHVIYASFLVAGLGYASPSLARDMGPMPSSSTTTLDATLTAVKTQANGDGNAQFDHSSYTNDPLSLNNLLNGSFNTTGSPVTNTTNNTTIEANQTQNATIGSDAIYDPVALASFSTGGGWGKGSSDDHSVGYQSGSNSINGNAFAAYAGIMNVSWNTGVDTNAQAATNIAAQGNVSFGNTRN
jgi:hypothetical protein